MTGSRSSRRRYLTGLGVAAATVLAGCTSVSSVLDDGTPEPPSYDFLRQTPTNVADAVTLSLPEGVPAVEQPADAALVVLPDDTDVTPDVAVDWWLDGTGIALLGPNSEETHRAWKRSDAHHEAFEPPHGASDSSPDPELLVSFAIQDDLVTTYGFTWGHTDDPSDREVLTSLEDALAGEAEDGRPRGNATTLPPTTAES